MVADLDQFRLALSALARCGARLSSSESSVALRELREVSARMELQARVPDRLYVKPYSSAAVPPLMSIQETASHLGIHPKTLARYVRTKGFPCVRVGSRIRFDISDVTAWVSARKEGR